VDLLRLQDALEASWSAETSYRGVARPGNPAYGQCYPTARVVQYFFPEAEVVEGEVWTGPDVEAHFWNLVAHDGALVHVDLSWSQFPTGSSVRAYTIRDRATFGDGPETVRRVETLLGGVTARLHAGIPAVVHATAPNADGAGFAPDII
jgi:hypothetical protein